MGARVLAMILLFMVILVASLPPSSCARLASFPTTNSFRDDDAICYYGEQVGDAKSSSFNNEEYGDVSATPDTFDEYYRPLANPQTNDDLQAFPEAEEPPATSTFDVKKYGAVGNGQVDDTQAFLKAWGDVGQSTQGIPTPVIPKGNNFLLNSLEFQGPCRTANVNFQLNGNIVAPSNMNALKDKDKWIQFDNVQGLIINGGGQIDGQGPVWWKACNNTETCERPTALHINGYDGLQLSDTTHINSPRNHISISGCNNVDISRIRIIAPDESPNTDGIDISASSYVNIQQSFIGTGDDCVALGNRSFHINITDVLCSPGHGISVGSLGKDGEYNVVEDVQVRKCTFNQTQNGARIKTWKGGSGYARHIIFEDIKLQEVQNPIIIDQKYMIDVKQNPDQESAVQVSDVTFRGFLGSVAGDTEAITLKCDDQIGCKNIVMDHIDLTSSVPDKKVSTHCENVEGLSTSFTPTVSCV